MEDEAERARINAGFARLERELSEPRTKDDAIDPDTGLLWDMEVRLASKGNVPKLGKNWKKVGGAA